VERFVGILVEHYAGAFPVWLAPVQVTVIPVADRHQDYARNVGDELSGAGIRVQVDDADETVGEKIRRAITHKHPAVIVVGDNDVENTTVGLRLRGEDTEERGVNLAVAVEQLAAMAEPPR
jgi:threonyl-tRNA synthetase